METLADRHLARLKQIDRILEGPSKWLIWEAKAAAEQAAEEAKADGRTSGIKEPPRFHNWISRVAPIERQSSRVATGLCMVTLIRMNSIRRRFPNLKKDFDGLGDTLNSLGDGYLPKRSDYSTNRKYFNACANLLKSDTLGALNPFTASQAFRVLMARGEGHAHSGAGCLAFFAMVWPLFRKNEYDRLDLGARIEPGRPSSYVTMKCLLPLISLSETCERRATVAEHLAKHLGLMKKAVDSANGEGYHCWRVSAELDELVWHLREMAPISVAGASFKSAANNLVKQLAIPRLGPRGLYDVALRQLLDVLEALRSLNAGLADDAKVIIEILESQIIPGLKDPAAKLPDMQFGFSRTEDADPARRRKYLAMLTNAAKEAVKLCSVIRAQIKRISEIALPSENAGNEVIHAAIISFLNELVVVNRRVGRLVSSPVDLQARWCHHISNREVAFTSADNFNDFDPAELISSIAIAVRTDRFTTPRQLADAVKKAVLGAQPDGSWRLLHPYFSRDGAQGIRAPAGDVVWTLTSALSEFPEIDVADEALFRFVDWLDRTQREIRPGQRDKLSDSAKRHLPETAVGWSSDQMREADRVNLLTTAFAVNALLVIRDLVEHRLWELCKRRFTVVKETLTLFTMDPVDLLAPPPNRLHSRLSQMAHEVSAGGRTASYSAVLHGPPGSSKTAVASALSKRMWRETRRWGAEEPRLIRITPADFTRRGEERVESEAQLIFRLLGKIRGVTVLFDEIDDLLRRRSESTNLSFLYLVIPAMLNRLQDLRDSCHRQEICFLFGTNYVERIEPALMRQGRIDEIIPVTYPDHESRRCVVERIMELWELKKLPEYKAAIRRSGGSALAEAVAALPGELALRTRSWPWSAISAAAEGIKAGVEQTFKGHRSKCNVARIQVVMEREIRAHSAPSQVNLNYSSRLAKQIDSRELRHEILYDMVSRWSPDGRLGPYMKKSIDELVADPAVSVDMRRDLTTYFQYDCESLPHTGASEWEEVVCAAGVDSAG